MCFCLRDICKVLSRSQKVSDRVCKPQNWSLLSLYNVLSTYVFLFLSELSELNLKTLIIKETPAKIQRINVNGTYPKGGSVSNSDTILGGFSRRFTSPYDHQWAKRIFHVFSILQKRWIPPLGHDYIMKPKERANVWLCQIKCMATSDFRGSMILLWPAGVLC